jgi:hypothetical protein
MIDKLIYLKEGGEREQDTWVKRIGDGHYAITQTETFNKKMHHTIYLTRAEMEQILKEEEVK